MADGHDAALAPIGAVQRTRVGREATEPMREDIRLLGSILGDTVREQNGEEVFDLVESRRFGCGDRRSTGPNSPGCSTASTSTGRYR
jgi:phosphoenolpyruvate carboxylase